MANKKDDYWMPGDATYVLDGKCYQVTETLRTVCVGELGSNGSLIPLAQTPPGKQKPADRGIQGSKPYLSGGLAIKTTQNNKPTKTPTPNGAPQSKSGRFTNRSNSKPPTRTRTRVKKQGMLL